MGNGGAFLGINLKNEWSLIFTLFCLHGVAIKYKKNFTFISREDEVHRYKGGCK
jgi:hypothetical protein